jgi:trigger factor
MDATRGVIKVEIKKEDYADQVEKNLRQYRQKADIPGFRKGMVPIGMLKKKYGRYILAEAVNKLVSDNVYRYIRESGLKTLGNPVSNQPETLPDFETQNDIHLTMDVALAPEITIRLTRRDKLTYYQVMTDEEMVDRQIESFRRSFGTYDACDGPVESRDLLKGVLSEMEEGGPKAGGILVENAILMPEYIRSETEKMKFIGARPNDAVIFNPKEAWQDATAEIASFLKVSKEDAAANTSDFRFEIKEITRHREAELDQTLYDKLFGEGAVTDEADFREKIKGLLAEQFRPQSERKFQHDVRALLLRKAGNILLADDILKRNFVASDENTTPEKVDAEYPELIEEWKYQMIAQQLAEANNLNVNETDILNCARQIVGMQFSQYGMSSVPDEMLDGYAKNMLRDKSMLAQIMERAGEQKIILWVKEKTDVETKEVTFDEFEKLFV